MLDVVREPDVVEKHLERLGAALREARLKANLTQGEVGEQAGVSRQLVSRIEQGCNGEISAYLAVASALRLDVVLVAQAGAETDAGYINAQSRLIF